MQYGLKPDITAGYESPLYFAMITWSQPGRGSQLDTIRFMLQHCDQVDDLEDPRCSIPNWYAMITMEDRTVDWFWHNISTVFENHDVLTLRYAMLQRLMNGMYSLPVYSPEASTRIRHIMDLMTPEIIQHYVQGKFSLLQPLFWHLRCSLDSHWYGQVLLDLLRALNIDEKACMDTELSHSAGTLLLSSPWQEANRKVVFEQLDDQRFLLSWIWDMSSSEPGYLIVSEYMGLGPNSDWYKPVWLGQPYFFNYCWPFSDAHLDLHGDGYNIKGTPQEKRFERREANKVRKERARTGKKRPRRMPGAWNW